MPETRSLFVVPGLRFSATATAAAPAMTSAQRFASPKRCLALCRSVLLFALDELLDVADAKANVPALDEAHGWDLARLGETLHARDRAAEEMRCSGCVHEQR